MSTTLAEDKSNSPNDSSPTVPLRTSRDSTPLNSIGGSLIDDNAQFRRFPMAADLAHRSYISPMLLDAFLKDTPEVNQKHVLDLYEKAEWKDFVSTCTGKGNSLLQKPSG
jgi:hypothetical protein